MKKHAPLHSNKEQSFKQKNMLTVQFASGRFNLMISIKYILIKHL